MDIEMSINPEILDVVEATTLENMKGLFGDLRTALQMMQNTQNGDDVSEEDFENLMTSANEKMEGMHEAFQIFDLVFGVTMDGDCLDENDDDDEDDEWVDELTPTPVDDYDRDPETGEMYDPETE